MPYHLKVMLNVWRHCAATWAPFARNQMQDACVARVDTLPCSMLGGSSTVGVPTAAEALCKVLRSLDACDSGAGSSTLASLSIPKLSLPVDAVGACCLFSVLPDSAGRYLREPERMVNDAMRCAQVMSTALEPYFDPVLVPPDAHISNWFACWLGEVWCDSLVNPKKKSASVRSVKMTA